MHERPEGNSTEPASRADGSAAESATTASADATHPLAPDRERAELLAELAAERARLRSLIVHMPAPLALAEGPEHRFTLINEAYRRVSGGGRDVTGLTPPEAFPELVGSPIIEWFDVAYTTGEPWDAPETLVRYDRDGHGVQDTWFNLRFEPVRDAAGRVWAVLNFAVDITDQVEARHAANRLLAESERARTETAAAAARSEAVLTSIADAFYLLDREWRFTYVNDAAEPLLQTTRDHLLGRTLWDAFPGVTGSPFEGPYREAMTTGRVTSVEAHFPPLGTWFDVRTYPWTGGLMVHFRDIGARKAAEAERERLLRALEVERARLQEVFRRAPSFIVALRGPELVFEFVNDAYYQLVGHRDVVGKSLLEALPEIRGQGFDTLLDTVLRTGEAWVGRESPVELQRSPGAPLETRYLDMVFQALSEADGTRSGVVIHGSDITAQVVARREVERLLVASEHARAEAEAARGAAELANQAKALFLANMSHELRTPLNAIGGYTQLLELGLHGPVTDAQHGALARIQAAQTRLLALINDVLNYAKLESGHVEYDLRAVDMVDVVGDVVPLLEPQLRAKGLAFAVDLPDGPCVVWADREKLGQVLVNLLANAVKFTDSPNPTTGLPGRVTVSVVRRADDGPPDAPSDVTYLRVSDTGRGIARDKQDAIFEPFVQVRSGYAQATEGTGLGLAISRDLARGMGGDLRVRSWEGQGSTFTISLRRVTGAASKPTGGAAAAARTDRRPAN